MPRFPGVFPSSSFAALRGQQDVDVLSNPAAGADWTYTVPGGYYRRLISAQALLTTSATVANRLAGVRITDGQNTLFLTRSTGAATASLAVSVCASPAITLPSGSVGAASLTVPTPNVWLPSGYVLSSATVGIQAGDQYSQIVLWWEIVDQAELQEQHNIEHAHRAGTAPATTGGMR